MALAGQNPRALIDVTVPSQGNWYVKYPLRAEVGLSATS